MPFYGYDDIYSDDSENDTAPDFFDDEDRQRYEKKGNLINKTKVKPTRSNIKGSSIEIIRQVCGITPSEPEISEPSDSKVLDRQVMFVSHAGENDYGHVEDQIKFDFAQTRPGFASPLAIDTQIDLSICNYNTALGRSLAPIFGFYGLGEERVWHFGSGSKKKPKCYFLGQHLAANDA
jgi:hypothetical protein